MTSEQSLSPRARTKPSIVVFFRSGRWIFAMDVVVLTIISLAMFYPFLWLTFSSFKTVPDLLRIPPKLLPSQWTLAGYNTVITRVNILRGYLNSFLVTGVTIALVLITSSLGGYVFTRLDFPGRRIVFYFVLATTMVPAMTLLIPQYLIMDRLDLLNTYWPLWLLSMFSSFGIFLWGQFLHGIPVAIYESAKLDGAGDLTIYRRIILPLCKPVMALQTISTFLGTFNAFLWPVLVLNEEQKFTLPILLRKVASRFGSYDYSIVMAGSVLTALPVLIVFMIFRRYIIRGIALTGIKA